MSFSFHVQALFEKFQYWKTMPPESDSHIFFAYFHHLRLATVLSDLYNALLDDETGDAKSIAMPILFNFILNPEFSYSSYSDLDNMIELTAYMDRNSGQYSYYKKRVSFSGQSISYEGIDSTITAYFTLKAEKIINN